MQEKRRQAAALPKNRHSYLLSIVAKSLRAVKSILCEYQSSLEMPPFLDR